MFKKIIAVLTTLSLLLGSVGTFGAVSTVYADTSVIDSGECGTNVYWSLDDQGILTISGEGEMDDYANENLSFINSVPWGDYYGRIKEVVVTEGVTKIGAAAFNPDGATSGRATVLEKATIADSVTKIGNSCFAWCNRLKEVKLSENLVTIDRNMFYGCTSLKALTLPKSVELIKAGAFSSCNNLEELKILNGETKIENPYEFSSNKKLTIQSIPGSSVEQYAISKGISFSTIEDLPVPLEGINFNESTCSIAKGTVYKELKLTYSPENTTENTPALWKSSDETIVTVDQNGYITAVNNGTATITAQVGDYSAECVVTVYTSLNEIRLNETELLLEAGESYNGLTVIYDPEDTTDDKTIVWSSSDSNIASVDQTGTILANNVGNAVITAQVGGFTASCQVEVTRTITGIRFEKSSLNLEKGSNDSGLKVITDPVSDLDNSAFEWSSTDNNVVTVDQSGAITAVGPGTAAVEAKLGELKASYNVTVTAHLKGIRFNVTDLVLNVGDTSQDLALIYDPEDTTDDKTITWSSSDKTIATVDQTGSIKALKGGETKITAKVGSLEAVCQVIVETVGFHLTEKSVEIKKGETFKGLKVVYDSGVGPENYPITWKSSDSWTVSVDAEGNLTGRDKGTAYITATGPDGQQAECKVTVYIPYTSLTINGPGSYESLYTDKTYEINYNYSPYNANQKVVWSVSDEKIATIDEKGVLSPHEPGKVTVTVSTPDGTVSGSREYTVVKGVTGISLNKTEVTMKSGETVQLEATVEPTDATDSSYYWSTSYWRVAEVSDTGLVTAGENGTAVITVRTNDRGMTAECTITVRNPVEGFDFGCESMSLSAGGTAQLSLNWHPYNATNKNLTWQNTNNRIASVDENGRITALKAGTATISATTEDGGYVAKVTVTVVNNQQSDNWYQDYTYSLDEQTQRICLTKYIGTNPNIVIPGYANINGKTYQTYLTSDSWWDNSLFTTDKVYIEKIKLLDGVLLPSNSSNLFTNLSHVTEIDLSRADGHLMTDMSYMFDNCTALKSIQFGKLCTENVTDMEWMFNSCTALRSLDLSGFNTKSVRNYIGMFSYCQSLTSLNLTSFDTRNAVNMGSMFSGCSALSQINLSSFNTSNVSNMNGMFSGCANLGSINLKNIDTSNVESMSWMFSDCESLTSLDVTGFNTSNVKNMAGLFSNCRSLSSINVKKFDTSKVTDMNSMFYGCKQLTSIDITGFNTHFVKNMREMFRGCMSLKSIDVTKLDTYYVESISAMFSGCDSLTQINVSGFKTPYLTNVSSVFSGCSSLNTLDLSKWDLSNVIYSSEICSGCFGLRTLKTPLNLGSAVNYDQYNDNSLSDFYDSKGKAYKEIPLNLSSSITLTRKVGNKIDYASVSGVNKVYVYSGKVIKPIPKVVLNGKTLVLHQDYYLWYGDNNSIGQGYIYIFGMGNYSGSKNIYFDIINKRITLNDITIGEANYTGKALKPKVTVKNGSTVLTEGKDYKLEYSNNTNKGIATVTVTGLGNYTGTVVKQFSIGKYITIAGGDRYSTAVSIAKAAFPNAPNEVILVTGAKFPDALSANAYAGAANAPVLLSRLTGLPDPVKSLLKNTWGSSVEKCTIIGGGFSRQVTRDLNECGIYSITKLEGATRFETAEKVMQAGFERGYFTGDTVIVATGMKAADALSVSPWSYSLHYPMLLAGSDMKLKPNSTSLIRDYDFKQVILLGDVNSSCACGKPSIRIKGSDRYETSILIAQHFMKESSNATYQNTGFALGLNANYPDALAAGMLQGQKHAPVILTKENQANVLKFCEQTLGGGKQADTYYFLGAAGKGKSPAYDQTVGALQKVS